METKSLSDQALSVAQEYARLTVGTAASPIPYFNNRVMRRRMTLRTYVGKGSPRDIREEVETLLVKQHVSREAVTDSILQKLLVDNNLGIDCSGFVYYMMDAECLKRGHGHLNRRLKFLRSKGPIGKMMSYLRPAENTDVKTFASDANTRSIEVAHTKPGDLITMTDGPDGADRNHILIVTRVDYENTGGGSVAKKAYYTHAIAYPEDGLYGTGVKEGVIEIVSHAGKITDQVWSEGTTLETATTDGARRIFERAQKSQTELRRLKWFS